MPYEVQFPNRDTPLFEARLDGAADPRLGASSHHGLHGDAPRNRPKAVARGQRHLLSPLQCFQHLARESPAALVAACQAELAQQGACGWQVAQVAGEGALDLSYHVLRVVAEQDSDFAVRRKRCRHEGSSLTTPSGRPGLRVYHLEHSGGRLKVQVALRAALSLKRPDLGHPVVVINLDGTKEPTGAFLKGLTDEFAADGDAL
jgi:hypothetical protein